MKQISVFLLLFLLILPLAGCSGPESKQACDEVSVQEKAVMEEAGAPSEEEETLEETGEEASSEFDFLAGDYNSDYGMGGMTSGFTLYDSGYFEGYFQDINMGEMGEDYPKGTVYRSEFTGEFSNLTDNGDGTYSADIFFLETLGVRGDYEIRDGAKYQVTNKVPPFEGSSTVTITGHSTISPDGVNVNYTLQ